MTKTLKSIASAITIGLIIAAIAAPAAAQMSKGEAAAKAQQQHKGKVLSVKLVSSSEKRNTYQVKILLPDGRVKTVTVSG